MWGNQGTPKRISILQTEANKLIDGFAQEDNIDIGLVPLLHPLTHQNGLPVPFTMRKHKHRT